MQAPIRALSSWPKHPGMKVCRGMEIPVEWKAQTKVFVELCEWRLHNNASWKQRISQTISTVRRNKRQKQISHYEGISHFEANEYFISVINFSQFRCSYLHKRTQQCRSLSLLCEWSRNNRGKIFIVVVLSCSRLAEITSGSTNSALCKAMSAFATQDKGKKAVESFTGTTTLREWLLEYRFMTLIREWITIRLSALTIDNKKLFIAWLKLCGAWP